MNCIKIGDLAKQTGLSIRTLHYYDEIELLSPSHRTDAGHRLYDEQDIVRLQQILSLRQLGFALHEIRECLANPEFSLPKVIDLHRIRLQAQIVLSQNLLKRLNSIAKEIATRQAIAVKNLMAAMETLTMTEQYLTAEQQETLEARFHSIEAEWSEMQGLAQDILREGTELTSVKCQTLAQYWQRMMTTLIGGDTDLYQSLTRLYATEGPTTISWGKLDAASFEFILKAVAFTSLTHELSLHLSEQNYTPEALHILALGNDAARELNLDVFGTEAILMGLLTADTSTAAQTLAEVGVTGEAVKREIVQLLGTRSTPAIDIPGPEQLPLAPRAKRVLELARKQAAQLKRSHVTPNHLLLGILREDEETPEQYQGVAIRVLQETSDVNLAQLKQRLINIEVQNL